MKMKDESWNESVKIICEALAFFMHSNGLKDYTHVQYLEPFHKFGWMGLLEGHVRVTHQ